MAEGTSHETHESRVDYWLGIAPEQVERARDEYETWIERFGGTASGEEAEAELAAIEEVLTERGN